MRQIDQILNQLPTDPKNSLEGKPSWLLSTATVFPEALLLPKIKPIVSSVTLNPDRPEIVEVTTNLDADMDGLTAMVLADALNHRINSKVMVFPSDDDPSHYELIIASEQFKQVVESRGIKELAVIAANHDLIRAMVPAILAEIEQDNNTSTLDFQELKKRADESVGRNLANLFKNK